MPTKRTVRTRHPVIGDLLTAEELELRAKWGGLDGVPVLTEAQRAAWDEMRRSRDTWHPHAALRYLWRHVDNAHGCGGAFDRDHGCPWHLPTFIDHVARDRREGREVSAQHPDKRDRLHEWLRRIEALGRQRDSDADPRAHLAEYYALITELGHGDDDDPA